MRLVLQLGDSVVDSAFIPYHLQQSSSYLKKLKQDLLARNAVKLEHSSQPFSFFIEKSFTPLPTSLEHLSFKHTLGLN